MSTPKTTHTIALYFKDRIYHHREYFYPEIYGLMFKNKKQWYAESPRNSVVLHAFFEDKSLNRKVSLNRNDYL